MILDKELCICDPTYMFELGENSEKIECGEMSEGTMCSGIHAASALLFSVLFLAGIYQIIRFWFLVSDKFTININLLYFSFIGICIVRIARYMLKYFDMDYDVLFHALYYAPLFLTFSSITILIPTWRAVYYTVTGKGLNSLAKEKKKAIMMNIGVFFTMILLFVVDSRLTVIPVTVCSVYLALSFYKKCYREYKTAKYRRSSRTDFSKITYLTAIAIFFVLFLVAILMTMTVMAFVINTHLTHYYRHTVWIMAEVAYITLQLITVKNLSFTAMLPLPSTTKDVSKEWVTTLLREKKAIGYNVQVTNLEGEKLRGGCHSKVRKIEIEYSKENQIAGNPPKAIVIKILKWNKTFFQKLVLFLRLKLGFSVRETTYLDSYQKEHQFYKTVAPKVKGIRLPKIYYNYEDVFNNEFGLIMEDVTYSKDGTPPISGQPDGFTIEESSFIIQKLAKFHFANWNHKDLSSINAWDIGGYWTSDKRLKEKQNIIEDYEKTMTNFSEEIEFTNSLRNLGHRLHNNSEAIFKIYNITKNNTLIHGDFKVSNIFVQIPEDPLSNNSNQLQNKKNFSSKKRSLPKFCKAEVGTPSVYAIDWQWLGFGTGAIDLAYFLCTSTEDISVPIFKSLVNDYHSKLVQKGLTNYSFNECWSEVRLAVIDFVYYLIVCKWAKMKYSDVVKYQEKRKDGLHLRSLKHIQGLLNITETFMDELNFN